MSDESILQFQEISWAEIGNLPQILSFPFHLLWLPSTSSLLHYFCSHLFILHILELISLTSLLSCYMCSESKSLVYPLIDFTPSAIFFQTWHNLCLAQPHLTWHSVAHSICMIYIPYLYYPLSWFPVNTHICMFIQWNWNLKFFFRTLPWGCVFGIFYIWQPSRGGEGGEWGNLNRAMHKLQKAKMKSGNAEIFDRNLQKSWQKLRTEIETIWDSFAKSTLPSSDQNHYQRWHYLHHHHNHHNHPHQHDNLFTW